MGKLKKLASETAIYGATTIVARIINFFFVPLYTRMIDTNAFGVYSEIFSYIVVLQVLFTFGMETTFFRFASKKDENPDKVFSTIITILLSSSLIILLAGIVFADKIANAAGYAGRGDFIWSAASILAIDCFTAVLFARLRFETEALKFGIYKSIKILSEVGFNLILFFGFPSYAAAYPNSVLLNFLSPTPDGGYILFAVLGSCIVSIILFIPDLTKIKLSLSPSLFKRLIIYAFPIVLSQLPGALNDVVDRIFFRFFSPEGQSSFDLLGIFNANAKLAVFMTLFVQMFRFAAEPFFFNHARESDQRQIYADVMKYFVIVCVFIFLSVALFMDIFKLFIGEEYRVGIGVVPIMLMANLLLGITFNLSMWYKISAQTKFAINITLSGLLVTILVNAIFMPYFGYYAAACGHLLSYLAMIIISWYLCKKYYPIPYDWKIIIMYITVGILLFALSKIFESQNKTTNFVISCLLMFVFFVFVIKKEKISLRKIISKYIFRK